MKKIFEDIVFFYQGDDRWLIYNVFNRQNILVESDGLKIFSKYLNGRDVSETKLNIWDSYDFLNVDGLLKDPSCIKREKRKLIKKKINVDEFKQILLKKSLLIKSYKDYEKKFKNKQNLLDFKNFGNFHQQLGQNLFKKKIKDFDVWWVDQKFEKNRKGIKKNLYRYVQENFLKKYIRENINENMKILDVGCGIGYFANLFGEISNNVIGIDPCESFIKEAQQNKFKAKFLRLDIGKKKSLKVFDDNTFDLIFMSDSLLFYFYQVIENPTIKLEYLLSDLKRVLKKSGRFVSVEPNYNNWLLPWFGSINRPFTILTEYCKKNYRVTPTQFNFIKELVKNGFVIVDLEEIYPTNYEVLSRESVCKEISAMANDRV